MHKFIWVLTFLFILSGVNLFAQSQQNLPDYMDLAEKEADRLEALLKLDDWQTFYVDSTLKHDYTAMSNELLALQSSKISNISIYIEVQDKWADQIDETYKRIFTETQWAVYLKNGAAKAQKARAKRKLENEK